MCIVARGQGQRVGVGGMWRVSGGRGQSLGPARGRVWVWSRIGTGLDLLCLRARGDFLRKRQSITDVMLLVFFKDQASRMLKSKQAISHYHYENYFS